MDRAKRKAKKVRFSSGSMSNVQKNNLGNKSECLICKGPSLFTFLIITIIVSSLLLYHQYSEVSHVQSRLVGKKTKAKPKLAGGATRKINQTETVKRLEGHISSPTSNWTRWTQIPPVPSPPPPAEVGKGSCNPVDRIVYLKTHKTASTTLATIVQRYGLRHRKSFALPRQGATYPVTTLFHHTMAAPVQDGQTGQFNMLANHARYNRLEMEWAVPGAKYVTILRHPVARFESAFQHWQLAKELKPGKDPLWQFFQRPDNHLKRVRGQGALQLRNGQLFDLGLDGGGQPSPDRVATKIRQLSREMDLVLISEYFDESLLLLKRLLCWDFADILYVEQGVRNHSGRKPISVQVREKILEWNRGDMQLYATFNQTLWQQIRQYGDGFGRDLEHFRRLRRMLMERCISSTGKRVIHSKISFFRLKTNAPEWCRTFDYSAAKFTRIIRGEQALWTRNATETKRDAERGFKLISKNPILI